ncbi:putative acetyltransferase [Salirhabdus euzebyi]|uniref:Putative acetyltransferase n=1 Tax=Salirhabdus euzebyi TaxID=394506 RepID=A0A841QAU2_9BACI|nr:GNAT family N-acetyltransferase [Salirhabdus euzebyi]MBB6455322.1 putative acetyltransferase [Salirhabdus euzebyi]
MDKDIFLTEPTIDLKEQYLDFYYEWKTSGEPMVPWVISKDPSNFQALLHSLEESKRGEKLPEGWVPDSTYWLVNAEKRVLGAVNIRHDLTEDLRNSGGHIGYGIRPTERRKGYATKLLSLSLEKTKELGIKKVLVVCDADNIGSAKTILNNGGQPDTDFVEEDGNVIKRFWIEIDNTGE